MKFKTALRAAVVSGMAIGLLGLGILNIHASKRRQYVAISNEIRARFDTIYRRCPANVDCHSWQSLIDCIRNNLDQATGLTFSTYAELAEFNRDFENEMQRRSFLNEDDVRWLFARVGSTSRFAMKYSIKWESLFEQELVSVFHPLQAYNARLQAFIDEVRGDIVANKMQERAAARRAADRVSALSKQLQLVPLEISNGDHIVSRVNTIAAAFQTIETLDAVQTKVDSTAKEQASTITELVEAITENIEALSKAIEQ